MSSRVRKRGAGGRFVKHGSSSASPRSSPSLSPATTSRAPGLSGGPEVDRELRAAEHHSRMAAHHSQRAMEHAERAGRGGS